MNTYLYNFVKDLPKGKALDLGAGNSREFFNVACLKEMGWEAYGVDKTTGINLESVFISSERPFDIVYSLYVIHFLKNRHALVQSAYENLKKGGYFFLQTFTRDKNSASDLDEVAIRELLEKVGFSEIEIKVEKFYDNETGHKHWHNILEAKAVKGE